MVRIQVDYQEGLRCRAIHGPSGRELLTDAPVDNCGRGESFSPTDLVATALGACMATLMGIVAARDRFPLEGLRISVEKEMVADPERRIGRLAVVVSLPAGLTEVQRRKLEAAARACPVRQSLSERVEIPVTFRFPKG